VLWRLRHNFELDRYIATREGREITLRSQQDEHSEHGTLTRRTSHCRLKNNPLPGWARTMVDAELALQTIVESSWYPEHFDESRCCRFNITTRDPRLDGKVEIQGRQWLEHADGGCRVITSVRFHVRIAVFGSIAENILAGEFGKGWSSFPSALEAYLEDHPDALSAPRFIERAAQTEPELLTLCLEVPVGCDKRGAARYRAGFSEGSPLSCWQRLRSLLCGRPRAHMLPVEAA
jgi:hypothetical protein